MFFTCFCVSVHNRPHGYSVTAHSVGYSITSCYGAVSTHPTGMLSYFILKSGFTSLACLQGTVHGDANPILYDTSQSSS